MNFHHKHRHKRVKKKWKIKMSPSDFGVTIFKASSRNNWDVSMADCAAAASFISRSCCTFCQGVKMGIISQVSEYNN